MVILKDYAATKLVELKRAFINNGLLYGDFDEFTSLLTPTATVISQQDKEGLKTDLRSLWGFYRALNALYQQSRNGNAPSWIKDMTEYGLSESEKAVTRIVSDAGLEPKVCRVDYVAITEGRKIAEVQWKSGGPGLFFGLQDVMEKMLPKEDDIECLGNMVDNYLKILKCYCTDASRAAVNDVRGGWVRGENYLKRAYMESGVTYLPIDRSRIAEVVSERNGRFFLQYDGDAYEIAFFTATDGINSRMHDCFL